VNGALARRWPWLLIVGGVALAFYHAASDQVLEARERAFQRLRVERFRAETPPVIRCGTPDPPRQPSRVDCFTWIVVGAHLVIVGVSVLSGALWKRRGGLAWILLATLLLLGLGLQVLVGYLIHLTGLDPEHLLWMFALAPALIVPLIALSGALLAKREEPAPCGP
jgi:hypothetical protein